MLGDVREDAQTVLKFIGDNWFKAAIVALGCYGFYYLNEKSDKNTKALQDTIVQMKTLADGTVIMRGDIKTAAELERQARIQMGKDFMEQVKLTNGTVTSLHTIVGELKASVENFGKVVGEKKPDGSFSTIIDQDRGKDKPPLTSVSLKYDATQKTLTDALRGSQWLNNKSVYKIELGEWRTDKDGVRSAASITRKVYKDDNQTVFIGEEKVPILSADAIYSTDDIQRLPSPPKYNFLAGTIHDSNTGRNGFIGILDTKVTRKIGISTGVAIIGGNTNYMLGTTYSFGRQ